MVGVVAIIVGIVAVGAWVVAMASAISIVGLVPSGKRLAAWFDLGGWRFNKIRAVAGPAVDPPIKRYTQAFLTFFLAIVLGAVVAVFAGMASQNGNQDTAFAKSLIPNSSVLET